MKVALIYGLLVPEAGHVCRGARVVRVVNGQRGANFTLILAVSSQRGVIYPDFFQGGTTQERFNGWLHAAAAAASDQSAAFIMDNAPCRKMLFQCEKHCLSVKWQRFVNKCVIKGPKKDKPRSCNWGNKTWWLSRHRKWRLQQERLCD